MNRRPDTHSVGRQHVFGLLLFVLGVHLEGVSLLDVLLEERLLVLKRAGRGRRLSARGHGGRATLAHELKLLHRGERNKARELANKRKTETIIVLP